MNSDRTDSIKLLFEWNKWLVAVETASIAALGFLVKDSSSCTKILGSLTILVFVVAILLSVFFLLNLPHMIADGGGERSRRLNDEQVPFRWEYQRKMGSRNKHGPWIVGTFTKWITRFFITGIILFALTFCSGLFL